MKTLIQILTHKHEAVIAAFVIVSFISFFLVVIYNILVHDI